MTMKTATAAIRCCRRRSAYGDTRSPDGSFAQFCRRAIAATDAQNRTISWKRSACYTLTLATAYRMLFGHSPHTLKPGDNVLVWGGSGDPGYSACSLWRRRANAIAVISDESRTEYVLNLGAKGVINRKEFKCWGQMPAVNSPEFNTWTKEARRFRQGHLGYHGQARC